MPSIFSRALAQLLKVFLLMLMIGGCGKKSATEPDPNTDIPTDPENVTVPTPTVNNLKPAATFAKTAGNETRIRLNLLGMLDPTNNNLPIVFTANQNLYISEDGVVQGTLVKPAGNAAVLLADVTFIVDNSGSMSEEADSVASSIAQFATRLAASGLDVRVGCVGYDDLGDVSGAINMTTASQLNAYLNRRVAGLLLRGTSRTKGFAGTDSLQFLNTARTYASTVAGENGVVAVRFAQQFFSWRAGAQRVYINFTDEPTQSNRDAAWATNLLCQQLSGVATIHTIWSGGDTTLFRETELVNEKPWRMSYCTGGTIKVIPASAQNLNLADLPVTNTLANSYLVEFITANPGTTHTVSITVKTGARADGRTVYQNVTY